MSNSLIAATAPRRDVATIEAMLNLIESEEIRRKLEAVLTSDTGTEARLDRVLTAMEAGRALGRSGRSVHTLANEGHLRRVRLPGRKIGGGFLESDVLALLARSQVQEDGSQAKDRAAARKARLASKESAA